MNPIDLAELEREGRTKGTLAAEVLVVGRDDWAIDDAISQLHAAGRVTHRCSETAEAPFPCNALIPGRGCPLKEHDVDLVLDIRNRPGVEPTIAEMGAICGLRDGLPLVVAGMTEVTGFESWSERVPDNGDIVSTCDDAVVRHSS